MPSYSLILLCLLAFFAPVVSALNSDDILPPEQAFKFKASGQSRELIQLDWQIEEGYHLYRDKIQVQSQTDTIQLGQIVMPDGALEHDPSFGEVSVYRDRLKMDVPLINKEGRSQIKLFVKYQGCADIGVCYPPQKVVVDVDLPAAAPAENAGGAMDQFVRGLKQFSPTLFQDELLPPEQAFQFFASVKDDHTVRVDWRIADGYYLYKDKLGVKLEPPTGTSLAKLPLPVGAAYHDEEFGQVEIYRNDLSVDVALQRVTVDAETVILTAKFQGCADRGVCYPPMQSSVTLSLPVAKTLAAPVSAATATSHPTSASEQDRIVDSLKQDSLALTLLTFFGFGLLLAHTPCVFPMIPILSGIIVGHGDQVGTRKAFLLSASFVFASALMYTAFGILAALFGSNLQAVFQEPWVIATFSGLFVLLSLSMFGFFELQLPASIQSRLHHSSEEHRDGSYLGAGIMGALSSLIVGPCVAAPLAAALIYIGQTGDVWLGGSALFVMGIGMGVPLLLIGASAGKLLPKCGPWLNATKSVFGVIMLAVAVWMLSRIVPASVTMLLTAMLLIIPAIYLNALEPLQQPATGWRKLWKGVGLMMLVFGVLQLIGLGAGGSNPLQPLAGLAQAAVGGRVEEKAGLKFETIHSVAELESKLQQAKAKGQWLMLDFYADWCISCKEMEAYTFADPQVSRHLKDFVLIQADVTENNDDDKALLKRFNLIGPPGIIFYAPDGQERSANRIIGFQDAATFIDSLKKL